MLVCLLNQGVSIGWAELGLIVLEASEHHQLHFLTELFDFDVLERVLSIKKASVA